MEHASARLYVMCVYKLRCFEVLKLVVHIASTLLIIHHCVLTPSTRKFANPRLNTHARNLNRRIVNTHAQVNEHC